KRRVDQPGLHDLREQFAKRVSIVHRPDRLQSLSSLRRTLKLGGNLTSIKRGDHPLERRDVFQSRWTLARRPVGPDCLSHREPLPRSSKLDFIFSVLNVIGLANLRCESRNKLLSHFNELGVVRVGLIKLEHREFRIVRAVYALIAEVAID